jgi:phosphopantetheine adenylyltransferase
VSKNKKTLFSAQERVEIGKEKKLNNTKVKKNVSDAKDID